MIAAAVVTVALLSFSKQPAVAADCTVNDSRPFVACIDDRSVNFGQLIVATADKPMSLTLLRRGRFQTATRIGDLTTSAAADGR
ncbi:MAG TPA: hypothetical protein VGC96_04925 [Candidatus Elarobacter sp.]